jgi:hypothetical protein
MAFFTELGALAGKDLESYLAVYKVMSNAPLEMSLRCTCALNYDLRISSWHPTQPITDLIKELKENGPLVMNGYFGASQYSCPPRQLVKKIEGREIYYWKKEDRLPSTEIFTHTILVVGAEVINGKGYAYYIDPNDESDPAHPEKERILVISYETLTSPKIICSNEGLLGHHISDQGYAYSKGKPQKK